MTFISSPELYNFRGYIQNDGKVGVRNDLLILNITGWTEAIAYRIGSGLYGAKVISFPYGLGNFTGEALNQPVMYIFSPSKGGFPLCI